MPYDFIFYVIQVPVYIRQLPSGDMTVWHPYNEVTRSIVEPICRENGRWHPKYNNWIIFKCNKELVLNQLRNVGGAQHG